MNETRFPAQIGGFNTETGELTLDKISSQISASSSISLSQNIYDGGVWWNTIRQARNSYRITEQFNRQVKSSKGCITTDQIQSESGLHVIYNSSIFKKFIAHVVQENAIYPYADLLSGINIHYAREGEELGWHFDNSSFAITLLLQAPKEGGVFQYVTDLRKNNSEEMDFEDVEAVLNNKTPVKTLNMEEGTLVLFRGLNSLHRVTPTIGNRTRILVVMAYNNKAGVSLSETARMTFFGRLS